MHGATRWGLAVHSQRILWKLLMRLRIRNIENLPHLLTANVDKSRWNGLERMVSEGTNLSAVVLRRPVMRQMYCDVRLCATLSVVTI